MDRRDFLRLSGAAAATGVAASLTGGVSAMRKTVPVGLGLYTVRGEMAKSVPATLDKIAEFGFGEVEFAGYFDHSAAEVADMLKNSGLKSPSAHVPVEVFESGFERALEYAAATGQKYLIMPWVQQSERTVERYKELFDLLNIAGEKAKAAGVKVAYHNHEFEFEMLDGVQPYEMLLERTDPDLVMLQLDLYWLKVAGVDPLALIERFPGRVPLVHVKDRTAGGKMTEVGAGAVDFARVFAASEKAGLQHYLVEHDNPEDPFASVAASIGYLKKSFPRFAS